MIQTFWKTVGSSLNMQRLYNPAIALCPLIFSFQRNKGLCSHKICTQVFTAALCIIVPNWEQPDVLWWVNRHTGVDPHHGLLLRLSTENKLGTSNNLGEYPEN